MIFYEELDFWQIPLTQLSNSKRSPFVFDRDWCAETLEIDKNGKGISKKNAQHGIVFCLPTMNLDNFYCEFKVTRTNVSKGKSHLFIGLVDKSKYKYENLLSKFWKDSPCSFYWDAWNTKLIQTDEYGIQGNTLSGYGCQCEDYETIFGIFYNEKLRTIEFYKNSVNIGVAFRNVPSNLTPSLDIWFESGKVEILDTSFPEEQIFF